MPMRRCNGYRSMSGCCRACCRRWHRAACWRCRCPTTWTNRRTRDTAAALLGTPAGDADKHRARILPAQHYYDLLTPQANVDLWRTTYHHRMDDAAAIVQWLRATGLKPYLDPLTPELQAQFLAEYQRRIDSAYPARADGNRLLAFPRLFIVARRRDR
jgi:trans-aconitate 2-methyltransferase